MLFTGCGVLYLQLLAVKPKNKNSKHPVATDFVKKFKHYSYPEEAEGWWLKVSLSVKAIQVSLTPLMSSRKATITK